MSGFHVPEPLPAKPIDRSPLAGEVEAHVNEAVWGEVDAGLTYLETDPEAGGVRFPWTRLDALVGPLRSHYLTLVGADTGNGKTSVMMHLLHEWQARGRRVYMVSLEIDPFLLRLYWACLATGCDPRPVIQKGKQGLPEESLTQIQRHMTWQAGSRDASHRVRFSSWRRLAIADLHPMMVEARTQGADVILLDHLHEIDIDGPEVRGTGYDRWVSCCRLLKELVREFQIPVVAAAQFHRDKAFDRLAPFLPPKDTAFQGGHKLLQVADVALGLYRPLTSLITKGEMVRLRAGLLNIRDFISQGQIGCAVLKHRWQDQRGKVCTLRYTQGYITDEEERTHEVVATRRPERPDTGLFGGPGGEDGARATGTG